MSSKSKTIRNLKWKYWYPISVRIEIALHKVRIKIDRIYRKVWPLVFILVLLPYFVAAFYQIKRDYSLIHNYANLDALFSDYYTKWRTDGNMGSPPPGGDR